MKRMLFVMMAAVICLIGYQTAWSFDSGSTGADGAFNPTTDTVVTLPEDGKLNYTTVNIPTGVTVTFTKNAANTPVYILATGNVTIAGTININGANGVSISPGRGGCGGFDGGLGSSLLNSSGGRGMGPGGGNPGSMYVNVGGGAGGGGFGTSGSNGSGGGYCSPCVGTGGGTYGNSSILPLIGGSGGGGGGCGASGMGGAGGGGGGAILIASSGTIAVSGSITANGGTGTSNSYPSGSGGGGSGGTIKLMANTITGEGSISARNGAGGGGTLSGGAGGSGRIRFEANTVTRVASTLPSYSFNYPGLIFVANMPTLKITSVGGMNAPDSPSGKYGAPDITLPSAITNPVTVNISGANIPVGTSVTVTAVPEYGASTSSTGTLSGTDASSTTAASLTLSTTYQSIIMARATFIIQTAMFYDGEKIEKIRVAATMGKESEIVYITESGKEITAELLAKAITDSKF